MGGTESHVEVHALFEDTPDVKPDLTPLSKASATDHLLHELLHPLRCHVPRPLLLYGEGTDFEVEATKARGMLRATRWGPPDFPWILVLPDHGGSRFHAQTILACCRDHQVSVVSVDVPHNAEESWGWHEGADVRRVLEETHRRSPSARCLALWGKGQQGSSAILRGAAELTARPREERLHAVLEGAHPTMRAFLEASHMRALHIPSFLKDTIYQRIRTELRLAARVDLDALDHARLRASIPDDVLAQIHHLDANSCPSEIVQQLVLEDVMERHLLLPLLEQQCDQS